MSKAATVDAYLKGLSAEKRDALEKLRREIQRAAPKAEEGINYGIPGFRLHGKYLLGFGATAKHCAFHPGSIVQKFPRELNGYDVGKGTIRFAAGEPLPASLVRKIV
ncbi:MAG: DUF1801 domain-containing protein [Verrucomicrobiota bacterium]|nr:DUF1801 domain-containing protein [Verrucomicrobiota bacterium]